MLPLLEAHRRPPAPLASQGRAVLANGREAGRRG
jgi:hypothetical protein